MSATRLPLVSRGWRHPATRKWLAGAALMLALALVAAALGLVRVKAPQPRSALEAAWHDPLSSRTAVVQCREAAMMMHDVRWAVVCHAQAEQDTARHAACLLEPSASTDSDRGRDRCDSAFRQIDGSAECHLPDERAAALNALLQDAERQCPAESARASP